MNCKHTAAHICAGRDQWEKIRTDGLILSRKRQGYTGTILAPGRSFPYDDLAEDNDYVFLSTSGRYAGDTSYGWEFDAARLVRECQALVCDGDLASKYNDIIEDACAEVAQKLSRLAPPGSEEIAMLPPEVQAFVLEDATDPSSSILNLVLGYPSQDVIPEEAVQEARRLAQGGIQRLKAERRKHDKEALSLLETHRNCEVLVPGQLSISLAVAEIREGARHALRI